MNEYATAGVALVVSAFCCYFLIFRQSNDEKPISFALNCPEQALPHWKGKRLDPVGVYNPEDAENIQCYCPATGQSLGTFKAATREDMDKQILDCHGAQQSDWKHSTFSQRKKVLNTISKFISDHQEDVARVACRDTGKTMLDASLGEIMVTLEKIQWIVKHGEDILKTSKRPSPSSKLMFYKAAEVRYEPLGVVSAMVSWNYPLHNMMGPIAAALFTGNGIVIKCSESVVWSTMYFLEIAKQALRVNGFDDRIVQVIACWPKDADYLTSHTGLNHITFIGSRPVAHKVATAAAKSLTPVVMELGGKDPLIVLDDVKDLPSVASVIMRGTFQSSGQNCIGIERVIACPGVYDYLLNSLTKQVAELRLGSSIDQQEDVDMGATITDLRFGQLEDMIKDAVAQGAKLIHGGSRYVHPKYPQGHYFQPTFLADVTPEMEIAQNEVFGPVLLLFKASSTQNAIEIANSTEFGLGGSVYGTNKQQLDYVCNELRTGNVAINDFATFALCQLPFGGVDGSGYGKFGGAEGLRGICLEKSVCVDWVPFIQTKIPRPLDYPIPDVKKAWEMVKNINNAGYAFGVWERVRAVGKLSKM